MIVDNLKNINLYKNISADIYAGLIFLRDARPDIELGTYPINERTKAIVSEYETISHFEPGYESHKHVIDIQYSITGIERILWSPIDNMSVKTPYNEERDCTFFENPHPQATHVDIGNDIFAIMFEEDGHSPQHYVSSPERIKKITIKVSTR